MPTDKLLETWQTSKRRGRQEDGKTERWEELRPATEIDGGKKLLLEQGRDSAAALAATSNYVQQQNLQLATRYLQLKAKRT